mmetsp:Transcript_23853/g.55523  ORF Transcript_23853/g.55523 Transcript_23853/m.55523 type:complete len:209 (+) Transcript_23853:134-760(+)
MSPIACGCVCRPKLEEKFLASLCSPTWNQRKRCQHHLLVGIVFAEGIPQALHSSIGDSAEASLVESSFYDQPAWAASLHINLASSQILHHLLQRTAISESTVDLVVRDAELADREPNCLRLEMPLQRPEQKLDRAAAPGDIVQLQDLNHLVETARPHLLHEVAPPQGLPGMLDCLTIRAPLTLPPPRPRIAGPPRVVLSASRTPMSFL